MPAEMSAPRINGKMMGQYSNSTVPIYCLVPVCCLSAVCRLSYAVSCLPSAVGCTHQWQDDGRVLQQHGSCSSCSVSSLSAFSCLPSAVCSTHQRQNDAPVLKQHGPYLCVFLVRVSGRASPLLSPCLILLVVSAVCYVLWEDDGGFVVALPELDCYHLSVLLPLSPALVFAIASSLPSLELLLLPPPLYLPLYSPLLSLLFSPIRNNAIECNVLIV